MEITPATTPAGPAASGDTVEKGTIASDFETFLKMLTTQIENQDPLNPMDSTEFATQLATFSGVEQQTLTNDLLRQISSEPALGGLTTYSGWIGREVAHGGPVSYDGGPVTLALSLPPGATDHQLSISTADGLTLGTVPIDGFPSEIIWSGQAPGGGSVLPGSYVLETVSTLPEGGSTRSAVTSYAEVREVRGDGGEVQLVLQGGQTIGAAAVTAVKAAGE